MGIFELFGGLGIEAQFVYEVSFMTKIVHGILKTPGLLFMHRIDLHNLRHVYNVTPAE